METGIAGDIKQLFSVAAPAGLDAPICGDHPLARGFSVGRVGTDVDFRAAAGIGRVGDKAAVGREPALAFAEFGVQEWFSLWRVGVRILQGRDPEITPSYPFAYDVEKSAAIRREIRGGCARGLLKNCAWFVAARMVDHAFSVRGPDWQRFLRLIKRETGGGSPGQMSEDAGGTLSNATRFPSGERASSLPARSYQESCLSCPVALRRKARSPVSETVTEGTPFMDPTLSPCREECPESGLRR